MNSYTNVQNGNPLLVNELSQKTKKLTWTELFVLIFFSVYAMFPSNQAVLYAGFGIVFISGLVSTAFSGNSGSISVPSMCRRLLICSVYSAMSFIWAAKPELVFDNLSVLLLSTLLTIILVSYFMQRGSVDILYFTLAVVGLALAIRVIVSYGGFSGFYTSATEEDARLGADINNVNTIGMRCAYSAVIIFGFAIFYKKPILYLVFLIPTIVAASSGSRKAVLIIIIGVVMLTYYRQQDDKTITRYLKYIFVSIILVLVVIYVLQLPIMATFTKRLGILLDFYRGEVSKDTNVGSTEMRSEMIIIGLKQFLYKPFMGIGLGNSQILNSVKLNHETYSHNDYIELLVNGGIIGFALYYSIYAYLIRKFVLIMKKDNDPKTKIAFVFLITFLISNWGCVSYYGSISTYLYLALWICYIELKKREGII